MVGWEVSRHPEWDSMYLAGLTAREIADRCHQGVATIHRHVQMREKYEPGYEAQHAAALKSRDPKRPSTAWRRRLSEALDFQAAHGRLPKWDGDPEERVLFTWIATQRRLLEKGSLPVSKIFLMEDLADWDLRAHRRQLDERWRKRLSELIAYVSIEGQWPRYMRYSSEAERILGVWLHGQHQRRAEGTLQPWRLQELDKAFTSWRSRM